MSSLYYAHAYLRNLIRRCGKWAVQRAERKCFLLNKWLNARDTRMDRNCTRSAGYVQRRNKRI